MFQAEGMRRAKAQRQAKTRHREEGTLQMQNSRGRGWQMRPEAGSKPPAGLCHRVNSETEQC